MEVKSQYFKPVNNGKELHDSKKMTSVVHLSWSQANNPSVSPNSVWFLNNQYPFIYNQRSHLISRYDSLVWTVRDRGPQTSRGSVLPSSDIYVQDLPRAKHKPTSPSPPGRLYVSAALLSVRRGRRGHVQKFIDGIGRIYLRGACRACAGKPEPVRKAERAPKVLDGFIQKR